jgi:hypothetical protein
VSSSLGAGFPTGVYLRFQSQTEFEKCLNRFAGLKFNALSLEVSILCVFAPLRALRETKKLRDFVSSCLRVSTPSRLRVKKMLQAFHLRVSIPSARETNSFFPTFAVQKF